jgi:hypothetical protein
VGSSDLDDWVEPLGLLARLGSQVIQGRLKIVLESLGDGDVDGCGNHIVGGLPHVDLIVGVDRIMRTEAPPGQLDRPVGDHFVGVHVGACSGAGLEDVQDKLAVEPAVDDLLRGANDQLCRLGIELAQIAIDPGGSLFYQTQRTNEPPPETVSAYRKILQSPLSLRSPVGISR